MGLNKSIQKNSKSKIISMWVYIKKKDETGKYIPVCQHYSSRNHFRQCSLPRQMTCDKLKIVNEEFSSMTQEQIDNLPTEEEIIAQMP